MVSSAQQSRRDSLKILRDTARVNVVNWAHFHETGKIQYDTTDESFYRLRFFDPAIQQNLINPSLGNLGTAIQPAVFSSPFQEGFQLGMRSFDAYAFTFSNTPYYLTLRPYSNVAYFLGMGGEQLLNVMHTQRIIKNLQLGAQYRHINSTGFYQRQEAVHHNVRFFGRFETDNKRYKLFVDYHHNEMNVMENGGLENDSTFILNGVITSGGTLVPNTNRQTYNVQLDSAANRWFNNGASVTQSYSFFRKTSDSSQANTIPWWSIFHQAKYEQRSNTFRDALPNLNYYDQVVFDSSFTKQSVETHQVSNELKSIFYLRKKYKTNSPVYVSARHEFIDATQRIGLKNNNTETDSTLYHQSWHNISIHGGFQWDLNEKISMTGNAYYYFYGYNINDWGVQYRLQFQSTDSIKIQHRINAVISYREFTPTFVHQYFQSNHIGWDQQLAAQRELKGMITYHVPEWKLYAKATTSLLHQYIYFDEQRKPQQSNDITNVFSMEIYKKFRAWKFFIEPHIIGQYATQDFIRIPNVLGRLSFYFESYLFKKALFMNLGVDVWYNSPFKANGYDPVTTQFYLQNTTTTGNYPFLDVYLNAKIKTVNVYVRLRNVNQRFPDVPYFYTPHHPLQDRSIQFGVSWNFYN